MSILKTTKKLVENRLKTLAPTLPIAWENVSFVAPADGSKYLRCTLSIQQPDDPCIGGGDYYRENIVFNVYVCDKLNIGTAGPLTTAETIRSLFHKGLSLQESNIRLHIIKTPRIVGGVVTTDRYVVPITIELLVESL